jgi:hypothetical protein
LPFRKAPQRDGQLQLFTPTRRSPSRAQGNPWVARWLRLDHRGFRLEQDPEAAARRALFRLFSRAMPTRVREVVRLLRSLRGLGVRQR